MNQSLELELQLEQYQILKDTKVPSYLGEFLQEKLSSNDLITLVTRINPKEQTFNEESTLPLQIDESSCDNVKSSRPIKSSDSVSPLDLTGSPLKLNLQEDNFDWIDTSERPKYWPKNETKHFPLSLQEARCLLNSYYDKNLIDNLAKSEVVFCVCDGEDNKRTVLLGRSFRYVSTYMVNIVGCLPYGHKAITYNEMKRDHLRNVRKEAKIEYLICNVYEIYGYNIKKCMQLDNVECNGSIQFELLSNKPEIDNILERYSDVKLNLQVVAGHKGSDINFIWEQLGPVYSFIEILINSSIDENTVICEDHLDVGELEDSIYGFFDVNFFDLEEINDECSSDLDLKEPPRTVLDELWLSLKRCKNVTDLGVCFKLLFQHLAKVQTRIQIPNADESYIAYILHGILKGTLAVPTITITEALEFLVELGLEYLKNYCLGVIGNISENISQLFLNKWSEIKYNKFVMKRESRAALMLENTKSSILKNTEIKHFYVTQMYFIIEFWLLLKKYSQISEDTIEAICKSIFTHLVESNERKSYSKACSQKLCEFSYQMNSVNNTVLRGKFVAKRVVQMRSVTNTCEIKTVFHISSFPIFPETIFNNYGQIENPDDEIYYVSKMVNFTERCNSEVVSVA